jgi:hypothetical protein
MENIRLNFSERISLRTSRFSVKVLETEEKKEQKEKEEGREK